MDNSSDEEDACEATTKPNAFDVLIAPPAKKTKVEGAVDPIMMAVIYIRWLRWIDPSDVLHNIPYVGQAVRSGYDDPQKCAQARWNDENLQAAREYHEIGLLAAIEMFGKDSFYDEVVKWRVGPREGSRLIRGSPTHADMRDTPEA